MHHSALRTFRQMDFSTPEHFDMGYFRQGEFSAWGIFGTWTFRHRDISAPEHFGTWIFWHLAKQYGRFGTDISAPVLLCRNVHVPKCPRAEMFLCRKFLVSKNLCIQTVNDIFSRIYEFTHLLFHFLLLFWKFVNLWKYVLKTFIRNLKFFLKLIIVPWADGLGAIAIPPVSVCHQESTSNEFITCFSQILNLRIFLNKFYVLFFRGLQSVFFCYDKQLYRHFWYKLIPCRKTKKECFMKKIRRFRNRENMWWAWPRSQRPSPTKSWNQDQASWFRGSPTDPNVFKEDLSYFFTHSSPYLISN